MALRVALVVAMAALAGCSSDARTLPDARDVDLEELRATARVPVYWVGPEFRGLKLTHASESSIVYGTCEAPGGFVAEGGCSPPIQIYLEPFRLGNWRGALGCRGVRTFRGVPAVHQNALILFTEKRYIRIIARSAHEELVIGRALQPLNRPRRRHLPPPARSVAKQVYKACG